MVLFYLILSKYTNNISCVSTLLHVELLLIIVIIIRHVHNYILSNVRVRVYNYNYYYYYTELYSTE